MKMCYGYSIISQSGLQDMTDFFQNDKVSLTSLDSVAFSEAFPETSAFFGQIFLFEHQSGGKRLSAGQIRKSQVTFLIPCGGGQIPLYMR